MGSRSFKVRVEKDYLKFNAAHFMAYRGFREALHGHNYRVSVEVEGELGGQGYVLDFAIVKQVARRVCERLDEKVLIPAHSNCLRVREESGQVIVFYENDEFRFPRADVVFVPIVHTSAEELAQYLLGEIRRELQVDGIDHIHAIQIGVEETPGQAAYCREEA
jgi:6-pyruvoyltetrahydropterin/6-carboxytetrahydropterin synthase